MPDTLEQIAQVQQEEKPALPAAPVDDYSTFLPGPGKQAEVEVTTKATDSQQATAQMPAPAAPAQTPAPAVPQAPQAPAAPATALPAELLELADAVGFSPQEVASFNGDAKALTKTINYLLRQPAYGNVPEHKEQEQPVKPESGFDPKYFENAGYDPVFDKLAAEVNELKSVAKQVDELKSVKERLDYLQTMENTRATEKGRALVIEAVKEAGYDPAILRDKSLEKRAVGLITSINQAHLQAGEALPSLSAVLRAVLPLVGAVAASPPQAAAQPPAQFIQQIQAPAKPGTFGNNNVADAQQQAIQRERNPMNGQFMATPSHRGGAPGDRNPLRALLVDHGIDPGPPVPQDDYSGFFGPK